MKYLSTTNKIAMILPVLITKNGTAKQCSQLSKSLYTKGYDVSIITFAYSASTVDEGFRNMRVISLIRIPHFIVEIINNIFLIEKVLIIICFFCIPLFKIRVDWNKYDVLHSHDWLSMWVLYGVNEKSYKPHKKIATINDVPLRNTHNVFDRWRLYNERKLSSLIDVYTVLDMNNLHTLKQWLNVSNEKVKIIRSGIDKKKYNNFKDSINIKKLFKLPSKSTIIVCANILSPHRKYEDVINAIYKLKSQISDMHILFLTPFEKKNTYSHTLITLARSLKLESNVHFINNFLSDNERMAYIKGCDMLIFPNYPQTWGLTVLEALALNVPVIVSSGSGVSEVLINKQYALIVEKGNIKELSDAILEYVKNVELRKKMANQGRKYVLSHFTWDLYAKEMELLYS